jgi:uncharacterized protein (DUF4213/DUF364 family)
MKTIILLLFTITLGLSCTNEPPKRLTQEEIEKEILLEAMRSPEYVQAFKDVHIMDVSISLAENGTLSKREVIDQYNATLYKMGQVKTFVQVKQKLKMQDKYLEMIQKEVAADIALNSAYSKQLEAESLK